MDFIDSVTAPPSQLESSEIRVETKLGLAAFGTLVVERIIMYYMNFGFGETFPNFRGVCSEMS